MTLSWCRYSQCCWCWTFCQWIPLRENIYTGNPHTSWENPWFPVDFPSNQSIDFVNISPPRPSAACPVLPRRSFCWCPPRRGSWPPKHWPLSWNCWHKSLHEVGRKVQWDHPKRAKYGGIDQMGVVGNIMGIVPIWSYMYLSWEYIIPSILSSFGNGMGKAAADILPNPSLMGMPYEDRTSFHPRWADQIEVTWLGNIRLCLSFFTNSLCSFWMVFWADM